MYVFRGLGQVAKLIHIYYNTGIIDYPYCMKELPIIVNKLKLRKLLEENESIFISYKALIDWEKKGVIKPFAYKNELTGRKIAMYVFKDVVKQVYDYLGKHPRASQIIFSKALYERRNGKKISRQ